MWPKSRKSPGKLEEVKKKVKLIAANGTPIEVFGEKVIGFETSKNVLCSSVQGETFENISSPVFNFIVA